MERSLPRTSPCPERNQLWKAAFLAAGTAIEHCVLLRREIIQIRELLTGNYSPSFGISPGRGVAPGLPGALELCGTQYK